MAEYSKAIFTIYMTAIIAFKAHCSPPYEWEDNDDDSDEANSVIHIESVLGGVAKLPCDLSPVNDRHILHMVLWYRADNGTPIYSFDTRGRAFENGIHWSSTDAFGPRAKFAIQTMPATLQLENTQMQDAGTYRCRVDFKSSPTRNFQFNLTVIVPPHQLLVYDSSGRQLNSTVGPLIEGSSLLLTCEVRGGMPTPSVSWYRDNILFGTHSYSANDKVVISKIDIVSVKRLDLNQTYTCQASNTHLTPPKQHTVRLELNLKPKEVNILGKPMSLVANEEHVITCQVIGSRPPPQVSWYKVDRRMNRVVNRIKAIRESKNETVFQSSIRIRPKSEDDGHVIKCKAENTALNTSLDDSVSLNVLYPPIVSLHFGISLNPTNIKEGDDVYFECKVKSNPPQHRINWYHNNNLVVQNVPGGIIISSESLVLQGVTYHSSGTYVCLASNERGETASQPVQLRVQYVPRCKKPDLTIIGASIQEVLSVLCQVDADPEDVTFTWQFNNSAGESTKVASHNYRKINNTNNELTYKPLTDLDYGTLICWADNAIGRQLEPCVFHLVQAAKPSKLHNCTFDVLENATFNWLKVECVPGYDGGLKQTFHLDIYQTAKLLMNVSNDVSIFYIDISTLNVVEAVLLNLILYTTNAKGRSENVTLSGVLLENPEKRTDWQKRQNSESRKKLAIIACTVTSACVLLLIVAYALIKL